MVYEPSTNDEVVQTKDPALRPFDVTQTEPVATPPM
jgi:hypothetical protein